MSTLKRFFQDTIIYGFATVLPRLMNFILVPLHVTALSTVGYSVNTTFFVWAAFFNVILTYGMETAFFRYFSNSDKKQQVFSTAFISLTVTTVLFFIIVFLFRDYLIGLVDLSPKYFNILLAIIALDTLVVVPFAFLRASNRPIKFAGIKIFNIAIVVLVNYFFLWLVPDYPGLIPDFILKRYSFEDQVQYIFFANLMASGATFLILLPYFFKSKIEFKFGIFKQMWNYGWPIMIAGIAFVINEMLDKILLKDMISEDIMGAYAGCYKLAIFMTIFVQAFRMGAEPFFFNHSKQENAKQTYANILNYFVILGSLILLVMVVFLDLFKIIIIPNPDYWVTISVVPIILLANLFLGIYHNLAVWYKLTDRTKAGMYISMVGALITIIMNILLIPVIGFMASAYTTLAAYGAMMLISFYFGSKYYPVPYNFKSILLYLLLAVGLSGISFIYFRENYFMGVLFLGIFLITVFLRERKDFKQILNQ
ncbi:lipopolysaccharide biosynthesis protein [Gillisia marina]|uniref:lipopolysaccharide biosynthesis protein n=1 Tax=Gillisia marina TaxID=1167637 RepID=UPI00029A47D1|nr:oligosaccharide flippase family protein [Gillisia marina]